MPTPNLFLIYVTDVERSTAFYRDLFAMEPVRRRPGTSRSRSRPGW